MIKYLISISQCAYVDILTFEEKTFCLKSLLFIYLQRYLREDKFEEWGDRYIFETFQRSLEPRSVNSQGCLV